MELVAEPAVLFLDEPTSGLDSSTSLEVCRILQRITKIRLLTVAAVIHSPSLATFLEFDDLLLLGKGGKVIYFGPTDKIEGYLDLIGFTRASSQTIPDFIMEVVAGKVNSRLDTEFEPSDLPLYWVVYNEKTEATVSSPDSFPSEISSSIVRPQSIKRIKKRRTKFLSRAISVVYTQSHPLQDMKIALSNFWADVTRKRDPQQDTYVFFGQFYYLWFRSAAQDFQNLTNLMTDYVLHFTVGVIISIGVSRSFTLAGLPAELCWTQAVQLMPVCNSMMSTYR